MPLLNITFWFLAGLIVGWFIATAQDDGFDNTMSVLSDNTEQNRQAPRIAALGDNTTENIYNRRWHQ